MFTLSAHLHASNSSADCVHPKVVPKAKPDDDDRGPNDGRRPKSTLALEGRLRQEFVRSSENVVDVEDDGFETFIKNLKKERDHFGVPIDDSDYDTDLEDDASEISIIRKKSGRTFLVFLRFGLENGILWLVGRKQQLYISFIVKVRQRFVIRHQRTTS